MELAYVHQFPFSPSDRKLKRNDIDIVCVRIPFKYLNLRGAHQFALYISNDDNVIRIMKLVITKGFELIIP